jgi:hypothetical protein
MATIQQIQANRLNAQKSTGPRSPEGKAVSRFNAAKTGIDAKSQIIPGEDPVELQDLIEEYRERWQPSTPEQRLLVDILVQDEWLLRRFRRIDAEIFECETQDAWTPKKDCPAGQAFGRGADTFSRLQRRIDSTERSYHRALKELQRLESERRAQASEASAPSPELASFRNLAFEDADAPAATPDSGGAGGSACQPCTPQLLTPPAHIPS